MFKARKPEIIEREVSFLMGLAGVKALLEREREAYMAGLRAGKTPAEIWGERPGEHPEELPGMHPEALPAVQAIDTDTLDELAIRTAAELMTEGAPGIRIQAAKTYEALRGLQERRQAVADVREELIEYIKAQRLQLGV